MPSDLPPAPAPLAMTVLDDAPPGIPASTVIVFRHGTGERPEILPEILMVQRSKALRFAGGAAVFPGGKIDADDHALAATLPEPAAHPAGGDEDPMRGAAIVAAIRETLEETGLLIGLDGPVSAADATAARAALLAGTPFAEVLAGLGRRIVPDALVPFARWWPRWEKSFDTRFFLADLGTGNVALEVDATENTRLFWATAEDALAMADAGDIKVIYPTRRNLERLAPWSSFAAAAEHARAFPIATITPREQALADGDHLTIPEGLGYPVVSEPLETAERSRRRAD